MNVNLETRKHQRVLCASLLEIVLPGSSRQDVPLVGVVEDIAARGLCISVDVPVSPGLTIELHAENAVIPARVRHCSSDEIGGYHIGVEFTAGYEWEAEGEWPPHRA